MKSFQRILAAVLILATAAYAQGNSWDKVRYNGGTIQTKVDPKDWDNHLAVTSDEINFKLKDGQTVQIATKSVSALTYGQEAHRRVGTMVALGILITPLALFGLFHKTRLHFIGIEYSTPGGKKAGLLLQGHKDNYRAILLALESATGAPLSVAEEDRKYVPAGINAKIVKGSETKESATAAPSDATGTVSLSLSSGEGEVYVDGNFMGNAPATLKLNPGKHTVKVVAAGFKEWVKEVTVSGGSEVKLTPTLEKL